jgi:hypothetical protein
MDISNKTLALFLVAAIILSLGGTIVSLNKLQQVTGPTGFISRTGRVNLTILQATDISLSNATIDFGTGVVNTSNTVCANRSVLSNNGTGQNLNNCWANDTYAVGRPNNAAGTETSKIFIQNDGNINVTITFTSAQKNYTNFIGNCTTEAHNWYRYSVNLNTSELPYSCTDMVTDWRNVSSGSNVICNESAWEDTSDAFALVFNITICNSNNPAGLRDDNLTITSTAAP